MTKPTTHNHFAENPNVEVGDADLQYLWEVTEKFRCHELWDLWCLRVAKHNDVWKFTPDERAEFFAEYSVVVTKLQHAADTGYVFSN